MQILSKLAATATLFAPTAFAAFGITTSSGSYVIDAGSSNPFKVTVSSSSCDITSILYRGEEFQYKSKGSHISSGLGSAKVTQEVVDSMSSSQSSLQERT